MDDLNQMAKMIGAFSDFDDLERKCRGGYIPTIRTDMKFDELPTRRAKELVRRELVARGYRVFDGHRYAGPDPVPLARQQRQQRQQHQQTERQQDNVRTHPTRKGSPDMNTNTNAHTRSSESTSTAPITTSKVLIDSRGQALVVHRRLVCNGRSNLIITSPPEHDHKTAAIRSSIMSAAHSRGGDYVRLSDVAASMRAAPDGIYASVSPVAADEPAPVRHRRASAHDLAVQLEGTPFRLQYGSERPELTRYAARAAAYQWQQMQDLPEQERRKLAAEIRDQNFERANVLGQVAVAQVQHEEGWERNPGILTSAIPAQSQTTNRGRRR